MNDEDRVEITQEVRDVNHVFASILVAMKGFEVSECLPDHEYIWECLAHRELRILLSAKYLGFLLSSEYAS